MITPRDYQIAGCDALWRQLHSRPDQNPLVVLATGLGKSLMIGMSIYQLTTTYPHVRSMMVTHVKELIEGNFKALKTIWPAAPAGIYSAGLGVKDHRNPITYAGIASVAKRAGTFGRIDFLHIDEAHRISDNSKAMYMKFIADLRKVNPNLIVIGYTATAYRMGSGLLTEGDLFDVECFNIGHGESFVWAIEQGYLIRLVPRHPGFALDESGIKIENGEYDTKETSDALRAQNILERAVDYTIQFGSDQGRKSWLTFCQSIEDAELVSDMFNYKGHRFEAVHSKRDDRDEVLRDFKSGKLKGVTCKEVLTTGFDHPGLDLIAMLRLTRSPSLWVQMLGRGTRPVFAPGYDLTTQEGRLAAIQAGPKGSCAVLDFVGNTSRLGPINYPRVPSRRGAKAGPQPMRVCPECKTYCHISQKNCPECGYLFPVEEKIGHEASDAELVAGSGIKLTPIAEKEFGVFPIHRMVCYHHQGKAGKPDSMRVDYFSGYRKFSEWVCLAHQEESFPRRKAISWWKSHGGALPAPTDIAAALDAQGILNKPKFIKVWVNKEYPEIVGHDFMGTAFELPPHLGGPPLREIPPDPLDIKPDPVPWDKDDEIPF